MKKVSIVIPSYNHLEDCLKPCLESLFEYTPPSVEVIVSANGCTDGTKDYLLSLGDRVTVVWSEEPLGYTRATNNGIKASTGEFIVLLNNDTVFLPPNNNDKFDWLSKLLAPFDDPKTGITGPMKAFSPEGGRDFLIFFCVCIRRNVFEEVGLMDEIFSPGFGEDTDLCFRASEAGWKVVQVPDDGSRRYMDDAQKKMVGDFPIFHVGEATFSGVKDSDAILCKNRALLTQRWNPNPVKLNLGCGDLKFPDYINIDLYNDKADLKLDVRDLNHFATDSVDEVKALHVLEHINPFEVQKTLTEWCRILKPGGLVHIEMPDIAAICENFKSADKQKRYELLNCIYGTTQIAHPHLFGWYDETLSDFLRAAGFEKIEPKELTLKDHWGYNMCLEARKPGSWQRPSIPPTEKLPKQQPVAKHFVKEVLPATTVKDLPEGYFTDDNIVKYRQLVETLPDGGVMAEIGVWMGRSICSIADIIKRKRLKVYAVDTFKGSPNEPELEAEASRVNVETEFLKNLCKYGIEGNIILLNRIAHDAARLIPEPLDLVFIDGDHSYQAVKLDLLDWGIAKVKNDGIVAGHDYADDHRGVVMAVKEIFSENFENYQGIWWHKKGATMRKRRIYDCFPFYNELDVLEIRLNELYDVVHRFVIVEGNKRHSGIPKKFNFAANAARFEKFKDKIIYIAVEDFPDGDPWVLENYQRACISRGLTDAKDDDIIIVSDCDEVPSREAVENYDPSQGIMALEQHLSYYFLNARGGKWTHAKIFQKKMLNTLSFEDIRFAHDRGRGCEVIKNGGWHFSMLGNVEHIVTKIESFADQHLNTPETKDRKRIAECIKTGNDLFNRQQYKFKPIIVDASFPKFVRENIKDFTDRGLLNLDGAVLVEQALQTDDGRIALAKSTPSASMGAGRELPKFTVTAEICTKGRLHTTLPLAISSVINQTVLPNHLLIFDDGEHKDPRDNDVYKHLFNLISHKGISWEWVYSQRKGQAVSHQMAIDKANTDLIWRVDDDDVANPDVLERLLKLMADPKVGAASSRVLIPGQTAAPANLGSGKIEDIDAKLNIQWCEFSDIREMDHFNNTFLYRKTAAKHGYRQDLSPAGHREETYFTYEMKRAGWKLLVDPGAIVWHMRSPQGGIRSFGVETGYWHEDELKFQAQLKEWGISLSGSKLVVLNNGMGDHFAFKMILPELKEKYKGQNIKLAVCYPEVFDGEEGVELISIADAEQLDHDQDKYNVYKLGFEIGWKGRLTDLYKKMYL